MQTIEARECRIFFSPSERTTWSREKWTKIRANGKIDKEISKSFLCYFPLLIFSFSRSAEKRDIRQSLPISLQADGCAYWWCCIQHFFAFWSNLPVSIGMICFHTSSSILITLWLKDGDHFRVCLVIGGSWYPTLPQISIFLKIFQYLSSQICGITDSKMICYLGCTMCSSIAEGEHIFIVSGYFWITGLMIESSKWTLIV